MIPLKDSEVVEKMIDLLKTEGWIRGQYYRENHDDLCFKGGYCVVGAHRKVVCGNPFLAVPYNHKVIAKIQETFHVMWVSIWNDASSFQEVIDGLTKVKKALIEDELLASRRQFSVPVESEQT